MLVSRRVMIMGAAALAAPCVNAQTQATFRFALTPVFLDNDAEVIAALQSALAVAMGQDIELVQRRTYQEISGALLDGSVDVHISGCPKGCAHPAAAAVTLCGTAAGIGLVLNGRASEAPLAHRPAGDLKPAIQRLGTLLRARRAESETAKSLLDRTAPATLISAYQGQQ